MAEAENQQRQFPRIPSRHTVLMKKLGDDSIEGFVSTKTVGLGGCSFVTDEPPGVGSALDLLISIEHEVAKAKARVVYENATEEGRFEVGVEFLELDSEDRRRFQALFDADAQAEP